MLYVYVGLAGALGALARYGIGMFRSGRLSPSVVTAVGTGFIGSFTTFSTFSVETIELLESGAIGMALLYVTLSLMLGLFSSWLGFWFGRRRFKQFRREEVVR